MNARRLALSILVVALATLSLGAGPALALEGYFRTGSFGGKGSGSGQFDEPIGVAVNDSTEPVVGAGDVYVVDRGNGRVERFSSEGSYESQFSGAETPEKSFSSPAWIAIDNSGKSLLEDPSVGDVYVADTGAGVIDKFSSAGAYQGQLTGTCENPGESLPCPASSLIPFGELLAMTVDRSGDLWVSDGRGEQYFDEFDGTGTFLKSVKNGLYQNNYRLRPGGLAIDSAGNIYTTEGESADRGQVIEFDPSGEYCNSYDYRDEKGATAVALEPSAEELLIANGRNQTEAGSRLALVALQECSVEGNGIPPIEVTEGLADTEGLAIGVSDTAYATQRAAGDVGIFKTGPMPPGVSKESASHVTATEVRVLANVNAEEQFTSYRVEYGTSEQYGSSTPEVTLGSQAKAEPISVSAQLSGLQPGVEYHFRFVATNANGSAQGLDTTFTTPGAAGASASVLPDERVYELVSTSGGVGESSYVPTAAGYATEDIVTEQLFQAAASGDAVVYMADPADTGGNGASGGGEGNDWLATRGQEGWTTSDITPVGSHAGSVYEAFSSDLSTGILEDRQQPPLAPEAPGECQDLYLRTNSGGSYRALFTTTKTPGNCGDPHFVGASADQSQVIFQSEAALTEDAQEAVEVPAGHEHHHSGGSESGEPCEFGCNLYDSTGGPLRLVNVLPNGETVANATFGGYSSGSNNRPDFSNAISGDGSKIFWTDTQEGPNLEHVYVLENGTRTVQVSGEGAAEYWTATPDGRYAYYTEAGRLWRFDTDHSTREELAGEGLKGEGAGVRGAIGVNSTGGDGDYLYFVATGVLSDGENGNGESAQPGQNNLYVRRGAVTAFIATLSEEDDALQGTSTFTGEAYGDWQPNLGNRTAEVTPDGGHLVFESVRPLTGYDNVGVQGEHALEVFLYAAGTEKLACVSCSPIGESPPIVVGQARSTLLPISSSDTYMRRWVSEDGSRVFFDTFQPLVSRDTNGVQDIYEWEREGTPGCPEGPSSKRDGGCVFLISSGESSDYSYFVDAGANGNDIFFTARSQLVLQDRGEKMNLYDARVDGYRPVSPPLCSGTGCQGVPPAAPIFATPSSVTFNGVGDFEPEPRTGKRSSPKRVKCGKGKVRKGAGCVRKKRAKSQRGQSSVRRGGSDDR